MAKTQSQFVCQSCGHRAPKWLGKCPECGEWNTLAEEIVKSRPASLNARAASGGSVEPAVQSITEIEGLNASRKSTGISEFDRTLGGGVVDGSLVLLGGDPGIGKSTLMLQAAGRMAAAGLKVLYVSGEESPSQIKLRAERLNALSQHLLISPEISIEEVLRLVEKVDPDVLILDSIQTFFSTELASAPGSIGQVREVAFRIFQEVKKRALPTFLIGHITKEGALAGPKTLEHIVDTVIYFEGDRGHSYRILRTIKNRFGSTPEIGVFEMSAGGLNTVENPSEIFLSERPAESPGSVIVSSFEGSRTLLVEVQALVSTSSSIGMPRRMATGLDPNRMTLLIAIIEKRLGLQFQGEDIFVNLAGGIKVIEPAIDMGVASAIASSFKNQVIDRKTVMIGEIGLTGEVRSVMQLDSRIMEAKRLGFTRCIVPQSARKGKTLTGTKDALEILFVKDLQEAFDLIF